MVITKNYPYKKGLFINVARDGSVGEKGFPVEEKKTKQEMPTRCPVINHNIWAVFFYLSSFPDSFGQ